jgi:peptidoglycan/xylan/chitin deacetylase (PgdA/CDA1 family)
MFRKITAAVLAIIAALMLTATAKAAPIVNCQLSIVNCQVNCQVNLPILMYHFVVENRGDLHICPYEFERDLAFLRENGYSTIGVSELIDFVYLGVPLPPNPVMLTFDDGYYNNYHYVFPLLREYDMKAVIFIIANHTDIWSENFYEDLHAGHLTWEQIREMQDSGHVEFGGHTYNMHKVRDEDGRRGAARMDGECLCEFERVFGRDTQRLNERFAEETGLVPNTFAFPFHEVCEDAIRVLQAHGYRAFFTYRGTNARNRIAVGDRDSLLNLYRVNRSMTRNAQMILREE